MVMTVLFHDAAHSLCVSETRQPTDVIVNSIQFWFVPVLREGPTVILFYQFGDISGAIRCLATVPLSKRSCQSFSIGYYCSVELVKVPSHWLLSKVELHITYQFLVLLFHYFRTNFASTWKNDTMKYLVNTTIAKTLSTSRKLRMMLLTNSSKRVSSRNETRRVTSTRL